MKCGECGNTLPPCDGFPKQVFCKRFHLHMGVYEDASRCRDYEPKPETNADRIRSMTDEELAEFISDKARTFGEEYEGYMSALDWLKQEADT